MKKRNLFAELKEGMGALQSEREGKTSLPKTVANQHIGSSFDDFLAEHGRLEEATKVALGRIKQFKR